MSRSLRSLVIALCASSLLCVTQARAQSNDAHYTAGVAAFSAGDYAKAVTEMSASLAATPSVNAALYLGNAHLKLGHLDAAKTALQRALAIDPATPKRAAIQELIKGIDTARRATVKVTSTPPGAAIYLEAVQPQNARGHTPAELSLTPGKHELVLVLEGYDTIKQTVQLKPKEKTEVNIDLAAKGCPLEVSAEPASAQATIDGAEPVAVPVKSRVGVGGHKVTLAAEGFETKTVDVSCDGTKPVAVSAKLERVTGRIKVAGATGVTVTIDGKPLTAKELAEGVTLPVGTHEVVFSRNGQTESKKTIVVAAAQEVAVEPPAAEPAPPPKPPPAPPAPPPPSVAFPQGLYVGASGGANITTVEWNLGSDTKGAYPKSSAMAGLRVGFQLLPRLAAEAEAHWVGLPNRLDDGLGHGLATDANAVFHILGGRWTPTVEGGAGTYQVLSSALRADSDLRLHAGVGVRGRIGDTMIFRFDVRDVITDGFDKSIGNNVEVLVGVDAYLWRRK